MSQSDKKLDSAFAKYGRPSSKDGETKDYLIYKDDATVWNEFKSGSDRAFTHIYKNYANILYNYGCQFTHHHDLVKDSLQELFSELLVNRKKLGSTNSIKYYLFKSIRRKILRNKQKEDSAKLRDSFYYDSHFEVEVSAEMKAIKDILQEEQRRNLQKAIAKLPAKQREAILLYFYEGFSYEQIAEILSMSVVKSARAIIYRAIDNLGKYLNNDNSLSILLLMLIYSQ